MASRTVTSDSGAGGAAAQGVEFSLGWGSSRLQAQRPKAKGRADEATFEGGDFVGPGGAGGRRGDGQRTGTRCAGGYRLHWRRGAGGRGTRGRRLGDCRDQGPADQLHQDRRHRRPRPLHAAGAASRQLQRVGARVWPGRLAEATAQARRRGGDAARERRRLAPGGRQGVSRRLLAVAARAAGGERVPRDRHGPPGQRHRHGHAVAEPLGQLAQVRLQFLSSARQPADAQRGSRAQGQARAEDARRGLGVAARHGRPRQLDVRRADQPGPAARAEDLLRLDRARRQGRGAADAAASDGRRTQRGADAVGLGHGQVVHARRDLDRQEPAHRERRRPGLRGVGRPRHADDGRPENASHRGDRDPDARPARGGALAVPAAQSAVAPLGRGAPVGEPALQPGGSAQRDAGQQGPRVDDVEDPSQRQRRVVHRTRPTASRRGSRCGRAAGRRPSTIRTRASSC